MHALVYLVQAEQAKSAALKDSLHLVCQREDALCFVAQEISSKYRELAAILLVAVSFVSAPFLLLAMPVIWQCPALVRSLQVSIDAVLILGMSCYWILSLAARYACAPSEHPSSSVAHHFKSACL